MVIFSLVLGCRSWEDGKGGEEIEKKREEKEKIVDKQKV